VLIALMLAIGAVVLTPAAPAMAEPGCNGILSVFVRGSQDQVNFNSGESAAFYNQLNSRVSGLGFQQVDLGNLDGNFTLQSGEYPAVGWADWGIMSGMDGYQASVATGASELTSFLIARANRCPSEAIIIGGYSQGAEVVGYALRWINDYTRSHIGYVALYGDPRDNSCSNSPWRRGSAACALGILGARGNPYYFPPSLLGRVGSWCDSHDGVCSGNSIFLPLPGNFLSTHAGSYQNHWIADSGAEVASRAVSKWNQLNWNQSPVTVPSYTVTPPDESPDSPAAPPPPPTVKQVKRTTDHVGKRQVYAATKSTVTEAWWSGPGDPVKTSEVIHISQENIVDFDKVNEPDGTTQSLYTAVPDGVWETWWRPNEGIHHEKIVTGLNGVRQVIADPVVESGQYTHRLYILAQDGPYEAWWREGGDGIHISRLDIVNDPVTMDKSKGPDGTDQLYVATPTYVYELWWRPGESVHHGEIIHISQGDIRSLDKGDNLSDGGQLLYTGTSTTAWQSYWNSTNGSPVSHGTITVGQTNAGEIEKDVYNGVHELYQTNGCRVQENWWNGPSSGSDTLIDISQCNITSFDKADDGADQQVYTASGDLVYETWWRAGVNPTSSVLFKVAR
jgi:hypothetical protein